MVVNIDYCDYTVNKNGTKMLQTRYSNAMREEFSTIEEARLFCQGVVGGLYVRYSKPAVRMKIVGGTVEEIFDRNEC